MEHIRNNIKYTVTLTEPTVTIDAIDYTSLCDYRVVIDPTRYEDIRTAKRLHTIIIDSFDYKNGCMILLHKEETTNAITLKLSVESYMFKVSIIEYLRPIKEPNEVQLLTNKIAWLNTKIEKQQKTIDELKEKLGNHENQLDYLNEFGPWLELWHHWLPWIAQKMTIKADNVAMPVLCNDVEKVKIEKGSVYLDDTPFVVLEYNPKYPLSDLIHACQPIELIIADNSVTDLLTVTFFEEQLGKIHSLKIITLVDIPNINVCGIARLPWLSRLTLRRCNNIKNIKELRKVESLVELNLPDATDLRPLHIGGPIHFVVNYLKEIVK